MLTFFFRRTSDCIYFTITTILFISHELINNVEDIVLLITFKVFNSHNFFHYREPKNIS